MFKKALTIIITLLIFSFSVVLMGNEPAKNYFPGTLGSFWIYEDQDGNELTRRAIEGEEIAGQTFPAFSYEPELEDWTEYSPFIQPSLYNVSDAGITLVVGDEVEKAVKARLSKEMESFREIIRRDDPDAANFTYNIEVEAQDNSHLLLMPITPNEEWDTNEIKASLALIFEDEEQYIIDYTIIETGIVLDTETVETAAGKFEDCLKVEYRTETTAVLHPVPPPDEVDPPGEIVTTVWFVPDVGIVKFHQKMNHMFFNMFPNDESFAKLPDPEPKTFELKKYEIKTAEPEIKTAIPDSDDSNLGNESDSKYFPDTLASYWVYEDHDGNELTRRAVEGEEIAGQTFPAFSYEPELKDWAEYSPFISPSLYNVSDAGITLVVGDEVEKAVKARLSKEMESLREIIRRDDPDAANFTYNIEVEAQDNSHLLLMPITPNEEWDTNEIKASLALIFEGEEQVKIDYTIMETGIVKGTETVVAAAGTFEDCLKVEYRTETTAVLDPAELPDEMDPPGEIVTTVWFAPDVGIVKFHQKMNYMFFDMFQNEFQDDGGLEKPPDPEPKTFELKKYEIKTTEPEIKTAIPDSDDSNLGNESDSKYFPDTLASYWVYEDQDGNELTRRAIEGEEIAGQTFPAFSYEPELKDWAEYSPFISPSLYNVSDAGIILIVGDEVEKGLKTRLKKETDAFVEALMATTGTPPDVRINVDIDVQVQDLLFLLPDAIIADEEWDANQIEAKVKMTFIGDSVPDDYKLTIDFTIIETGIVLGTDSVETAAGTFEDCLKVEYRTETKAILDPVPRPDEVDPPGETVTTVWFAPDVGIVKFHQKMNYMFFDMVKDGIVKDDDGLPKPPDPEPKTFELKKFEIKTAEPEIKTAVPDSDDNNLGNESDSKYFPDTLASYWVYEDQDGIELTRRAIEGEEIAGKTFPAFSYEPKLKDWAEYSPFISPSLYNVSDAGITLVVGDEVEKAVKARLSKEMEYLREIIRDDPDAANFTYNILKAEAHKHSYLLPTPVVFNEEWDVNQIKASLALGLLRNVTIDYTINETGIIRGTETIKTAAGTFEDCLKVEYRTETTIQLNPPDPETNPPGETITTVWFAPSVGIVKFHQKMKYTFLETIPDDADLPIPPDPEPKTFELKRYEIRTADSENEESN